MLLKLHRAGAIKGHVVTTGTCMVPLELQPGDSASADFGPLGRVEMIFSET
jgi:2-keto-4-pentenoate hydratase